jgi:hypothetical protein
MLHCFGLLPAESAGWIPIKQAHTIQVPSNRGMSPEDGNCQSQEMPTQLKQVVGSFLSWFAYGKLTMSMTWQISPGSIVLILSPVSASLVVLIHNFIARNNVCSLRMICGSKYVGAFSRS